MKCFDEYCFMTCGVKSFWDVMKDDYCMFSCQSLYYWWVCWWCLFCLLGAGGGALSFQLIYIYKYTWLFQSENNFSEGWTLMKSLQNSPRLTLSKILVFPVSTWPKTHTTGARSTLVVLFFSAASWSFYKRNF